MKICNNKECKQINPQPLESFALKKSSKDGHKSRCKSCINENGRNKPKTEIDKENSRKRTAKYRKSHRERLELQREEKKKDPIFKEKARYATARYRAKYPEKIKEALDAGWQYLLEHSAVDKTTNETR